MKNIAIIGSTGSIGTQTLDIVRKNPDLSVSGLSAKRNIVLLEKQIREFKPKTAAVYEEKAACELREKVRDMDVQILSGMEGLLAVAGIENTEMVVTAIVGMIGILPTIEAIKKHKHIALANKETLVTCGHIIMPMAKEYGVYILPVDSEHSAIFQCLEEKNRDQIAKIILTASGGPFRGQKRETLKNVRVEDALKHPNWEMGHKITIDSATMVNKGLEVMEAKWLFDMELDKIEVILQPQSIIHSMVEYKDTSVIAQLGSPDMRLPIQYALFYPCRRPLKSKTLDFKMMSCISFEAPDPDTFLGLKYAYSAAKAGGSMPTVFNAANERAVEKFLTRKIGFLDIYDIIAYCMESHKCIEQPSVEEILQTEQSIYELIESRW